MNVTTYKIQSAPRPRAADPATDIETIVPGDPDPLTSAKSKEKGVCSCCGKPKENCECACCGKPKVTCEC